MTLRIILVAFVAAVAGCGPSGGGAGGTGAAPAKSAATSPKVDKAVAIAKEMQANPDQSEQVLAKHGLTEQQFEDLMYEIAADPVMSEQYASRVK